MRALKLDNIFTSNPNVHIADACSLGKKRRSASFRGPDRRFLIDHINQQLM